MFLYMAQFCKIIEKSINHGTIKKAIDIEK